MTYPWDCKLNRSRVYSRHLGDASAITSKWAAFAFDSSSILAATNGVRRIGVLSCRRIYRVSLPTGKADRLDVFLSGLFDQIIGQRSECYRSEKECAEEICALV